MCPPFVVDMDAVEGNDKVCGITAFLTTAYAILPQMSRSYVVFGKVRTLPFTTYIFVKSLYNHVKFRDTPSLFLQLSLRLLLFCALDSQLVFHNPSNKFALVLLSIGHYTL